MAEQPCAGCGKPMGFGEYTVFNEKEYHIECFKCKKCGKQLSDDKFLIDKEGNPHHPACIPQSGGGGGGGGQQPQQKEECCKGCGEKIVAGVDCVRFKGGSDGNEAVVFHEKCFKCAECGKPIGETKFGLSHGKPVHPDCMHHSEITKGAAEEFDEDMKCVGCGEQIKGRCKVVPDFGRFHLTCFKCSRCKMGIRVDQEFYKDEGSGQPVCARCMKGK